MIQTTTHQGDGLAAVIGFVISFSFHLIMNFAALWTSILDFLADAGTAFILGAIGAVGGFLMNRVLKRRDQKKEK